MEGLKRSVVCAILLLGTGSAVSTPDTSSEAPGPRHFVCFGLERARIAEASFLDASAITGAQLKYTWRELEPERDRYELGPILENVRFLESHGKRLFIQLQDVSFEEAIINVPDYLLTDPAFGGGVARQYSFEDDDETIPVAEGWVARRWDPAVRARFDKLLAALGATLDGRIEGLTLPETSIGFGETGKLHPSGYDDKRYFEAIRSQMSAAAAAFPNSHVIQYANFMPGEWLPGGDRGYLRGVYDHAARTGAGVGGPDLLPHRKWQRKHSYPLIAKRAPGTVAGVAVQWGNLEDRNPVTGERVTVAELRRFAEDELRLEYVFWGTQEPFYSDDVLPSLHDRKTRGPER